jgi:hypothetical protein
MPKAGEGDLREKKTGLAARFFYFREKHRHNVGWGERSEPQRMIQMVRDVGVRFTHPNLRASMLLVP